jgi:hypothetical protein
MYPTEEITAGNEQPIAFLAIEQCRKELSRLEGKLSPIMSGGLEKGLAETPAVNELDSRLQALLTHICDISRRVKL